MKILIKYINYARSYIQHGDFGSVIDSIRYVLLHQGAAKTRVINTYLGKMKVRKGTNDFQFTNYFYEWKVKSFILKNPSNFDIFFDIGAGVGDYSILMAKKGLRVFSFEPIKSTYDVLRENIKLNDMENIITSYNYAIGFENTSAEFVVTPINTGASHRIDKKLTDINRKGTYKEIAKIRSLDSLLEEFNIKSDDRILLKMDMEGMEIEGIIGANEFINRFKDLTIAAEAIHSNEFELKEQLSKIANFEIGNIDKFNIYAKKLSNLN